MVKSLFKKIKDSERSRYKFYNIFNIRNDWKTIDFIYVWKRGWKEYKLNFKELFDEINETYTLFNQIIEKFVINRLENFFYDNKNDWENKYYLKIYKLYKNTLNNDLFNYSLNYLIWKILKE